MHGLSLRHVTAFCSMVLFVSLPSAFASATDLNTQVTIHIAAQRLDRALLELSNQAQFQLVLDSKNATSKTSIALSGTMSIREAMDQLLRGSDLTYRWTGQHTVTVTPVTLKSPGTSIRFDIPAEALSAALKDFTAQSAIQVIAPGDLITGKTSKAAHGTMAATEALRRVLKGTGLTFAVGADGSYAIQTNISEGPGQEKADAADVLVESQQEKEKPYSGMNVDLPRTIDDVQPYYIFDSTVIEQSGALNVEDFLKQRLTMNTTAQANSQLYGVNPSRGGLSGTGIGVVGSNTTSSINLRGLGANETLILVNGRRMAGVTIGLNTLQPDVNGIPLAAIDRIEVLPSSASGIYGGSAIGGVINIILKKNFHGGEVKAAYENAAGANAAVETIDGTYGFSFEGGKTQLMITGHYSDAQPLLVQDRRGLISRGLNTILRNNPSYLIAQGAPFPGGTTPNIVGWDPNNFVPINLILRNNTPLNSSITHIPPGATASTNLASALLANAGKFNLNLSPGMGQYGLRQPIGFGSIDKSLRATLRREMTPWLEAFTEFSYTTNRGSSVFNSFPDSSYFVPATAPTNPFQEGVLVSVPSNLSVPNVSNSAVRAITSGLTAKLPYLWTAEMDYTWSKSSFSQLTYLLDNDALTGNSSFGVLGDLNTGVLNPFVDTIANPPNLNRYLQPNTYSSSSTLNDLALRASGPLFHLPWGDPNLTIGLEHRKEGYPTNIIASVYPITTYNNNFTYEFGQTESTNSVYVETNVPLVTQKNAVPGVQSLEFQLADRREAYVVSTGTSSETVFPGKNYSTGGPGASYYYSPSLDSAGLIPLPRATASYSSNTETFGLKYKPLSEVILRASLATAFLPPTYSQLLPNPRVNPNADFINDPKTGTSYLVNTIGGGNPNLKPQRSKSWNAGLIYEPKQDLLEGLRVDLEFYQITQLDFITNLSGNQILSAPSLSNRVRRDPITGSVTQIDESALNAAEYKTEGWDLSFDYRRPTSLGIFDLRAGGTAIKYEKRQLTVGLPLADFAGFPNDGGEAKLKANATLTWDYQNWTLAWTATWFGSYNQFGAPGDPLVGLYTGPAAPVTAQGSYTIPSQMYHDLFVSYAFGKGILSGVTMQLGIKNLFNTLPPFDAQYTPFFYSPYGDIRLRDCWLSVRESW